MKKETLGNMKRFLAMLLTIVLVGSSLQPAREVFATEGNGVESGTELETETMTNQTGEGETKTASGGALESGEEGAVTVAVQTIFPEVDSFDNDEMFAGYVEQHIFGMDSMVSTYATLSGNRLGEIDKAVYTALKEKISLVAVSGGSTEFVLDVTGMGVTYTVTAKEGNTISGTYNADISKIIDALLTDCPYELYWYDKTEGVSYGATSDNFTSNPDVNDIVALKTLAFDFKVASAYQDASEYAVSATGVTAAANAKNNADSVIVTAKNETSVYNQLLYCLNYIKDNVEYGDTGSQDNNTWQMIWVFDGNADTNVVCEGYAKAFKYLCDGIGVECYTVTGMMGGGTGAGGHMWNIVVLDSNNYLVDPTNCDDGTIGSPDNLFLKAPSGGNGTSENPYTYAFDSQNSCIFYYDDEMFALLGDEVLTLATEDYDQGSTNQWVAQITAADGTRESYSEFSEALANWTDGTTLTLLDNVEITETIELTTDKSSHILDLNGKELKVTEDIYVFLIGQADEENPSNDSSNSLTVCDSGTNGKLTGVKSAINVRKGSLTIEGGNLTGLVFVWDSATMTGGSVTNNSGSAIQVDPGATLWLSDGSVSGVNGINNRSNGTVVISGKPEIRGSNYAILTAGGSVTISGAPVIEGTQQDFRIYNGAIITFASAIPEGTTYSIKMDSSALGKFAVAGAGVTLSADNFTSAVEGCAVVVREDGLYLVEAITDGMVTWSGEPTTYNGNAQTPTVIVKDSETTLTEGTDYKVMIQKATGDTTFTTVTDIKDAGTYRMVVTGMGTYGGEVTKTFTIAPATLTVTGATATGREYDGTANVKITVVAVNGILNSDAVSVNVAADGVALTGIVSSANAGTYTTVTLPTLTLTGDAAGNYIVTQPVGAVDLTANVTISPKEVEPTLEGLAASYIYTGEAIEPSFTLKDGDAVIPASEYTVSYSNNTAIGTATITISDVDGGNYVVPNGTVTFIITAHVHNWTYRAEGAVITATCDGEGVCPANYTATITLEVQEGSIVFDGSSKTASVTQNPANTFANVSVSYKDANGTALTGAPANAGTYTAFITMGTGEDAATAGGEFTIQPANLGDLLDWGPEKGGATLTWDKDSYVYTGSEIKPVPTITWNNMTLLEGKDYTLKYYDGRINAGEEVGLLQITGIGNFGANTNCYNYWFTIEKAPYTPAVTEASFTQNYTKESFTVNLYDVIKLPNDSGGHDFIVPEGSGATITWNEENGYVLTATITNGEIGQEFFFPVTVETNNYKDYVFTIKLTLAEKKDQTISWNEAALDEISWTYGDEPVDLSDYLIDGEGSGKVTYTVESATEGFTIFGDATVDGPVITFVHAGGISITAHKAADEEYNEATSKVLWRFIEPINLDSTLTFAPVTEAGTMISDVEVTSVIEDKDGNPLSGSVEWYEWSEEEDDWTIIETPEAYEVQEGVEYKYRYVPQDTNYRDLLGGVILWSSHAWTYTVDENTITATCTKHEDCVVIMKLRIVDTLVYDGTEQRIIMENSNPDLLDMPEVFYEMKNGTEWKAMDEVPVNAGTYRAGFTLGDATAYLEYTVEKAPMDTEGIVIRFSSSVTYDEGKPVSVVEEIALNGVQKIYYSTSTNNRTWSDWTETMPTMSQPGYLYVKAKVVVDDNYEEYVTAVSVVRMINSSSGGNVGGGGSYYPPYVPSYPSYPVATPVPTTAPTPVPTVAPTAVPTEAPKPTEAPVPTVTPVPGTVMVETTGNAVVDEKGEEITSIIQEPGTTNKLNIPGFTDTEGAEVAWKSTNPEVAEVDENGNVTLKAPGLAEVVVTVGEGEDAKTETIVVYVEEPRTYVNPLEEAFKDVRLGTSWGDIPLVRYQAVGETIDINFWGVKNWEKDNYDYVWQTSDNSVAAVDSKGRITAVKPGVVSLTLGLKNKTNGNLLNVQSVEVVIPENTEEKILLGTSRDNTFDSIELKLNERIDINFYGVKNWKKDEYEYHWSSSEPSVVYVDSVGKLTPVSPGKAEVFLVLVEKKTGAPKQVIPVSVTVPEKEAK